MTARLYDLPWAAIDACATPQATAFDALDRRLAAAAQRVRARDQCTLDELRGISVGHARVESLLADGRRAHARGALAGPDEAPLADDLLLHPAWRALARWCAPGVVERELVLLALARELFSHYEPVFGYLNDDLTRRWPTRALALQLLARSEAEASTLTDAMGPASPLVQAGVLRLLDVTPSQSASSVGVGVTPLAVALLGDARAPWQHLPAAVRVEVAPAGDGGDGSCLYRLDAMLADGHGDGTPLVVLEGRRGSGRTMLTRALAASRGCPLLHLDLAALQSRDAVGQLAMPELHSAIRDAVLFQRLHDAVILVDGIDAWCDGDPQPAGRMALPEALTDAAGPVLLRVAATTRWHTLLQRHRVARLAMPALTVAARAAVWRRALASSSLSTPDDHAVAAVLADRFDITPGEVRRVVTQVTDEQHAHVGDDLAADAAPTARLVAALSLATRTRSRDGLGALAVLAPTPHSWDDLVLPANTMRRLQEFTAAVRDRTIVLDAWQFGRRAAGSRGATALFAGASGTGKTMACSVIARELGLDLYVIDLSAVVSKYIGETEKNLDRIFRAARDAGAVLFFDEADALFGKRSEVKDAHDRYANIEVAYLLQQLDAHDGIVVLATNLARNLDAAFSRRMRYVVEFPLPAEADRLRLWRGVLPPPAPLADDVDLPFLAGAFSIAGGDIRNVALDAAYLAASEGLGREPIAMRHFVVAMARQCVKQGLTPSVAQFRQYAGLLPRNA